MQKPPKSLRDLPSVSAVLASRLGKALVRRHGKALVTDLLREQLAELRRAIGAGELEGQALRAALTTAAIGGALEAALARTLEPRPREVINATGVVVHTNLGRSTLSAEAAAQVARAARGYLDLEYDTATGGRGNRQAHLAPLMARLFPGHGFLVVNNNAAAILLCLRALAAGKQALVSRGELVEIGGSFRVPDILEASGAKLREVGTTNRTRRSDYADAIDENTGLILKVHTSNFRIVGFTEETTIAQLAGLAAESGVPLVVDWGSGDLVDLAPLGIDDELPVGEILEAGADLVTFSGDKLMGGPQAGFVVGKPGLIETLRRDPMARVCRLDRLLIGALHQTLKSYVRGTAHEDIPTLRMLAASSEELNRRAGRVRREVAKRSGKGRLLEVIEGVSKTGGGSSPAGERPTRLLAVRTDEGDAGRLESRLRAGTPPIIGRVQDGRLLLDLRTVLDEQEPILIERLVELLAD